MKTIGIKEFFKDKIQEIENHLDKLVPEQKVPYNQLLQATRYSLLGSGKRLRPILTLITTETLQGDSALSLTPACCIEMIHTYSMIHDDLPCMDDDDFRRGKPTLHRAYPESLAVLSGDFLLTYAFELLADSPGISSDQKISLISLLAKNSGKEGMIGGQVMDIEAENQVITANHLQEIHEKKTGALISASVEFGAIIANASIEQRHLLRKYGQTLGLAFQINDDIIDVTSSLTKHGHAVSSDEKNQKSTYVTLLGVEEAQKKATKLIDEAIQLLRELPYDTHLLESITKLITQ